MGQAIFAGREFRVDPSSISWDFRAKTSSTETVGGRVIQVYGTLISDMVVSGSFGVGGWQQQEGFLREMEKIGIEQAESGRKFGTRSRQPLKFIYPPRDWDFLVYLKRYSSPDGPDGVVHDPAIFAPKWTLTLFVVEENAGLKKVAEDAYIARLAKGLGWKESEFSGGEGEVDFTDAGVGTGSGSSAGESRGNQPSVSTTVNQWRPLVEQYFGKFGSNVVNEALKIMQCESEGNPDAKNPIVTQYGNAMGLFQHLEDLWAPRATAAGFAGRSPFDPEANIAAAAYLYGQTNDWRAWECRFVLS